MIVTNIGFSFNLNFSVPSKLKYLLVFLIISLKVFSITSKDSPSSCLINGLIAYLIFLSFSLKISTGPLSPNFVFQSFVSSFI